MTENKNADNASARGMEVRPKVSIILPVSGRSAHLAENLRLLKSQTFRFFEVIITYNEDSAKDIIDSLAGEDKRFKTVKYDGHSMFGALSAGLKASTGEYLWFLMSKGVIKDQPSLINHFYSGATRRRSDLVAGRLVNDHILTRETISSELSKTIETSSVTYDMTRLSDLSSTLIRRELIEDEWISFDGDDRQNLFLFKSLCVAGARIITGYDQDVFFRGKSAPGAERLDPPSGRTPFDLTGAKKTLDILKLALDKRISLEREVRDNNPKSEKTDTETEYLYEKLRSSLVRSYINDVIIGGYLRNIWLTEEGQHEKIASLYEECLGELFDSDRARLFAENDDLDLKDGFPDIEKLRSAPVLSVVLMKPLVKETDVALLSAAYYRQSLSSFEFAVDERLMEYVPKAIRSAANFTSIRIGDAPGEIHKKKLSLLKGTLVNFAESGIFPEPDSLRLMNSLLDTNLFATSPLLSVKDDILVPQRSNEGAFVRRFCFHKLHTIYNKLDLFWGNKLFNRKKIMSRKLFFTGRSGKDLYRIYTTSSFVKVTPLGFVTTLSDSQVISRTHDIIARLRYRHYVNAEMRRIRHYEKESFPTTSYIRLFNNLRLKWTRSLFKFATLRILFPLTYALEARKPLNEKKVVFMVPRQTRITPGLSVMHDTIKKSGKYEIKVHYLNKLALRLMEKYRVSKAFVKDIATAKYVFADDVNADLSHLKIRKGTHMVQLWHGCGAFKKFGYSTAGKLFGLNAKEHLKYPMYSKYTLFTVSSPEVIWAYEEAALLEGKGIVQATGISRSDVFYDKEFISAAKERVLEQAPFARGKKIILYAPTFRGSVSRATAPDRLDYNRLFEALGDEYVILVKHHPFVSRPPVIPEKYRDSFAADLSAKGDISDLLCAADICISDYSSLVFEYSLLERPLIFFAYDLDTYFDWRGFYYDYFDMTPGPVVSNTEEIIDYITHIDERFDLKRMQDFRYKFMRSCDGNATRRILDSIGLEL